MADPRAELEELRRLDELEKRAFPSPQMQSPPRMPQFNVTGDLKADKEAYGKFINTEGLNAREREVAHKKMLSSYGWGTGLPKTAYDVGGAVTDATGSPEAGFAANVATNAIPAIASGFKTGAPSVTQKPAEWLMQQAVKPSQGDRETGRAAAAIRTMLEKGINPTEGGMDKASQLANRLHETVDKTLAPSTAEVNIQAIGQKYLPQYEKALSQANPDADIAAVSSAWKEFEKSPLVGGQESIPVQLAHILKQGTQRSVNAKSGYGEMGSTTTEAQKAIARLLRESVAEAEPGVAAPLAEEAAIRNAKDVMQNAVTRSGNRNLLGMAGAASSPGMTAAMLADSWTWLKAMGAQGLHTAGKPEVLNPLSIAGGTYSNTDRQRMAEYLKKRAAEQGAQ